MTMRSMNEEKINCPSVKTPYSDACIYLDIMDNIQAGIIVFDAVSEAIFSLNRMAAQLLKEITPGGDRESSLALLLQHDKERAHAAAPYEPKALQIGERFIGYTVYGIRQGYRLIILRDITDRQIIEENNALLATVVQSAAESIMVLDVKGLVQYVNPAFETVSGYMKEETIGKRFIDVKGGIIPEEKRDDMWATLRKGETWHEHIISSMKDGSRYEEDVTITPVKNQQNNIVNYVAIMRDVTEKVRLESIVAAVNNMNNIGYVFSGIRHEIGNPVNSLKVALSVLLDNIDIYPLQSIRRYIERSLTEILRIEELLTSLRNYNMFEHPSIQAVAVEPFMNTLLSLVREDFLKKGISTKSILHPEAQIMQVDPRALKQILLNILTNAADALDESEEPKIILTAFKLRNHVIIQVIDNGNGMSEEQQQNLFRPFFTTKAHGTGLGLIIVRKMLSQMNCSLDIVSQKNAGTIVDIAVPAGSTGDPDA